MRIIRKELRQVNRVAYFHTINLNLRSALGLQRGIFRTVSYDTGSSVRKYGGELAEHTIGVRW